MRLEIPDDFCDDPRFERLYESPVPAEKPIATVMRLLCSTAKKFPDGFRPDIITDTGWGKMLADSGWLDANPVRVHNWLDYANAGLRNQCRKGKRKEWYDATIAKWKALGWKPREFPASSGKKPIPGKSAEAKKEEPVAVPVRSPAIHFVASPEPEQLTLAGEKIKKPKRILSGQQKIIEKFAEVKKLDFSTREARHLIAKQSAVAAASIDKLSEGDTETALVFVEIACAAKDDEMAEWTKRDGQEHPWRNLSAILPMWSEFKSAWDKRKKPAEATSEHREAPIPAE